MVVLGSFKLLFLGICVLALLSIVPQLVMRSQYSFRDDRQISYECPSKSGGLFSRDSVRYDRIEEISGGAVVDTRPPIKMMLLVGQRIHATMMSRWIFQIFEAARSLPHYTAYLWGEGYVGYNAVCKCEEDHGSESFVACPSQNPNAPRSGVPPLGIDLKLLTTLLDDLNTDVTICKSLEVASFADHIGILFGAFAYPFDTIILTWPVGPLKRDEYFKGVSPWTSLLFFELEWHKRSLEQYAATKPDIVITVFTDHVEENFPLRKFVRSIKNNDIWKLNRSPVEEGYYRTFGPDTLFAYAPQSILPQCSKGWSAVVSGDVSKKTDKVQPRGAARSVDILMVGHSGKNYPTRVAFNAMVDKNIGGLAKLVKVLPHPGYTELNKDSANGFDPVQQFKDYMSELEDAKICFVGIISTWSIRKYKEAMAAGCLVVGDLPADHYLSKYVVNVKVTIPGYVNLHEDLDVDAANTASNAQLGPISKWWCSGVTCDTTLEEDTARDSWMLRDLYSIQNNVKEQVNVAKTLAAVLNSVLVKYNNGEYDKLVHEAQRMVMTEYSWQQTLVTRVEPAISAWHRGERGWLRTPAYFLDSHKYRARHYFLLREWMLRRYGDDIAPAIKDLTFGTLLREASRRLRTDNMESCLAALALPKVCNDPMFDYFHNMTDFDILFVQSRGLYRQKRPLDGFSDKTTYHMRSLYGESWLHFFGSFL